mmetsp:Transcript_18413/g.40391  ORF Transcript_18413/g.40391 Transcript_18413/m.40391 type:complete len:230 (+) Transcript_18413:1388-2077(+)
MASTGALFLVTNSFALAGSLCGNQALWRSSKMKRQNFRKAAASKASRPPPKRRTQISSVASGTRGWAPMGCKCSAASRNFSKQSVSWPLATFWKTASLWRARLSSEANTPCSQQAGFETWTSLAGPDGGGLAGWAPPQLASCSPVAPPALAQRLQQVSNRFIPRVMPGCTGRPQPSLQSRSPSPLAGAEGEGAGTPATLGLRRLLAIISGRIHLIPALEETFTAPAGTA